MAWFILILPLWGLHDPTDVGDPNVCRCVTVKAADGWCPKCRVGYYAAQRIESASVFQALDLHGHEVDAEKTHCQICRNAIREGGFCDVCHMGYINGRGYFSRVCYHLAKGRNVSPASSRKSCCPPAGGWCATCKQGVVGNRTFDHERDFGQAQRYYEVLISSLREAGRCEHCAMAMIADSRCHLCRIEYKDGKPIGQPSTQPQLKKGD